MNVGEANSLMRRIPLVVYVDGDGSLASDADRVIPAHAIQVSLNGAAFVDAAGTFVGDGSGAYWYEATLSETLTAGFIAIKYQAPGFQTAIVWEPIGQIFGVGESAASRRRLPFVIYDAGMPPSLATGAAISLPAHALRSSRDGAAFADASGELVEVGSGLYYYQGTAADVVQRGTLAVMFSRSGYQTQVSCVAVGGGTFAGSSVFSVTAVSPAPGVAPGEIGGFSVDFASARNVAITIDVTGDTSLLQPLMIARFDDDEEVVFRRGQFGTHYNGQSMVVGIPRGIRFIIRRTGGWRSGLVATETSQVSVVVDALDTAESPDTWFSWTLPAVAPPAPPTQPVVVGMDHVAGGLGRLPEQFKEKPNITKLLRALLGFVQEVENAGQQALTLRRLDNAVGHQLGVIGKIVGQTRDGLQDEDYRRYCRARVAANRATGTGEDILRVTTLVLDDRTARLVLELHGNATYVLRIENAAVPANVAGVVLMTFLAQVTAAGVRPILESGSTPPETWFRWDAPGQGWDNGRWIDARDPVTRLV